MTLADLRRFSILRTFFSPTTLRRALEKLAFVQADPIRAPARAQDLILRHRVKNYRIDDLELTYSKLGIEEDFFVVYGFVTKFLEALMHPRVDATVPAGGLGPWPAAQRKRAQLLLDFIVERGIAHPREVNAHFAHGRVTNYWGGSSNATTHLLDAMHYRGMIRVVRRENGIRLYAPREHGPGPVDPVERRARIDGLVDAAVNLYAPVSADLLSYIVRRLRYAVPQWQSELKAAFQRAKDRLSHGRAGEVDWYWPAGEKISRAAPPSVVRILTPFDPLVWDRDRVERLWGWVYRFEAYTPAHKRKLGYYAMPMLWRDQIVGWANLAVEDGDLKSRFGYIAGNPPRDRAFRRELDAELQRFRHFLRLE